MNIDLNKHPWEFCICGSPYWRQRTCLKKIPAFLTGNQSDIIPVEFMACEKCGRPHSSTKIEIPKIKTTEQMKEEALLATSERKADPDAIAPGS